MVIAAEHEVKSFAMPGTGIPDFDRHAALIARAGIYDVAIHHSQIVVPVVVKHWRLAELEGLTPDAEAARERLFSYIDRVGRIAQRLGSRQNVEAAGS